jgi:hypothetical protein
LLTRSLTSLTIFTVSSKILLVYEEYSDMSGAQSLLQKVGFDVLAISTEYTLSENVLSFNPDIVVASGRGGKVSTVSAGRRLREMTRWQGKVILILPSGYKPNPQDFAKIRADMLLESPIPPLRLMQVVGKMLGIEEHILQERLSKHGNDAAKDTDDMMLPPTTGSDAQERFDVKGKFETDDEDNFVKEKARFNLDISSEVVAEAPAKKETEDLEALWDELTTPAPGDLKITSEKEANDKAASKKVSFDLTEEEISARELEFIQKQLATAKESAAERVSKYGKFTAQIDDFDTRQSLSKADSRKAQQDLVKDWNHKEIESQDELRRGFTKALFRKK